MSLLLRKSVTSAAKVGARRRLPSSSYSGDAWFPSAECSFWHQRNGKDYQHSSARSFGTTVRSLVTSWRDQDDYEKSKDCQEQRQLTIRPSTLSSNGRMLHAPPLISRVSFAPPMDHGTYRAYSRFTATKPSFYSRGFSSRGAPGMLVRFVPQPRSIRSSLALSQLVAAERSASDAALRAFTTWVLSSSNNQYYQNLGLRFISTNSDGSRPRHPDLVRKGIRKTKIPTPPSGDPNEQQSLKPEDVMKEINKKSKTVVLPAIWSGLKKALGFLLNLPKNLVFYLMNPSEVVAGWKHIKKVIKDEVDHYWVGTKVRASLTLFVRVCLRMMEKSVGHVL